MTQRLDSRTFMPLTPALLLLGAFMVYPVASLLLLSFQGPNGQFSLVHFVRLVEQPVYFRILSITFQIAAITTLFSLLLSYPVAYLIANSAKRSKSRLVLWVLLSFWTSFLVRTFAWIVILGRNGIINQFLTSTGLADEPARLIFNFSAVIIGMTHALVPLCILTMLSVMENIDKRLPQAALTLGAKPGSAFWTVYFPLSFSGVTASGLMVFISALAFFITPAFLGGPRETMWTQLIIEQVQELMNWGFAGALSVLLLIATLVVFFLYDRLVGMSSLAGGAASASSRKSGISGRFFGAVGRRTLLLLGWATDAVIDLFSLLFPSRRIPDADGATSLAVKMAAILIIVFLVAPAAIMIPLSFTSASVIDWPPRGFSLNWYSSFFNSTQWMGAFWRSTIVAFASACLAMLIGMPAAFTLVRGDWRGKTAALGFLLAPMIIPRMIIAVALFYFYAQIGLVGTSLGLVLGHTVLALPYVVITIMAVLKSYDERLDQAAWSLGATPWQTLRHITLPLISVGMLSSFLFAFITSFDELTIALFVTGGLTTTLPKLLWDDATLMVTPIIASASTILIAIVAVIVVVTEKLKQRQAGRFA